MATKQTGTRDTTKRVAMEIEVLLTRRRMSAASLARELGVSQTYVWRRLSGETAIDLDDLERIAELLQVEPIDLMRAASGAVTLRYPDTLTEEPRRVIRDRPMGRRDSARPGGSRPSARPRPPRAA